MFIDLYYSIKYKQDQDTNQISFKIYPLLNKIEAFCSSASDFIICFQSVSEISKFEYFKGNDTKIFYFICKIPSFIFKYTVVLYVIQTDITNLNFMSITCTSDSNKIINYLILHIQKISKIQKRNVKKLKNFLKNKNSKMFDTF